MQQGAEDRLEIDITDMGLFHYRGIRHNKDAHTIVPFDLGHDNKVRRSDYLLIPDITCYASLINTLLHFKAANKKLHFDVRSHNIVFPITRYYTVPTYIMDPTYEDESNYDGPYSVIRKVIRGSKHTCDITSRIYLIQLL